MKMKLIVATITWIALISSMFYMPLVTLSSATYSSSASTGMDKTEDTFGGSFSPREMVAAPDEAFDAKVRVELNTEPQRAAAPLKPGPSPPESFRTYGSYWNDETNALSVGRYMPVQNWDEDTTGSDDFLAEGWASGKGYFDIMAPNDEELLGGTAHPHIRFPAADTTPPTGSIIINSGAAYTNSRSVTLTLSATDAESGVASMRFADDYPSPFTWSAWYPYATTFSFYIDNPGDGVKYVDVQFIDGAGNPTTPGTIYDYIYLDTTAPTGSVTINSGNPAYTTSTAVTLYLTYSDSLSGVKEVYYANAGDSSWTGPFSPTATKAWTLSSGDGTKTVYYAIFDNAGNSRSLGDSIILDTAPPTGSVVINSGAAYTNSRSVTLTLSATDAGTGVASMRFADDYPSTFTWSEWYPYATTFDFIIDNPDDGMKYVDVQFIDGAGHLTTEGGIYDGIILDTTSPTGSIIINYGDPVYTPYPSVTLYLTYSDSTSGVKEVYYSNEGDPEWTGPFSPTATKAWTLSSGDGTKTVYYRICDNAGNAIRCDDSIILDTTPPTGSIIVNSGDPAYTTSTSVTLYLTYSDSTSGVKEVYYANEGDPEWTGPFSPTATMAWTLPSGDGAKRVDYLIVDYAGNWNVDIDSIILDTVAPTITSFTVTPTPFSPNGDGTEDTTTVAATFSETVSWKVELKDSIGTVMLTWTGTGTSLNIVWNGKVGYFIVADGVYEFALSGEDLAGWSFPTETEPVTVDTRPWHDIAVVEGITSRTRVGKGYPVLIDVTVENHGDFTESFNLTVYYGDSAITAEQWEIFWSLGDVNRDGYINGTDLNLINAAFWTVPGSDNWNPWADLNQDGIIDIFDALIVNPHLGLEIWTYAISGGVIGTLPVIELATGNTQTLTFTWDTSSTPYGDYVVCSYAVPILGKETDRVDNCYQDGTVMVTIPGDANGDRMVNVLDIGTLNAHWSPASGTPPWSLGYSLDVDTNDDGYINSLDIGVVNSHWGQSW